jgi:AcrR family transcriptional regulator
MQDLPVIQPQAGERADAARNRERILCAARRLFDEKGPSCVSMDEIAEAAGVGKGTLFRRFGSRAALAMAVLSEDESRLQEAFIRGEPPLGPGVCARERLIAFGEARLDLIAAHAELLVAAEAAGAHFDSPPYMASRLHVTLLLREIDPDCDPELLADTLLAGLTARLLVYQRDARGFSLDRIKEGWRRIVDGLVPAGTPGAAAAAVLT